MAINRSGKNAWVLFLLILVGIVLGSFLGSLTEGVKALSWLNFGKEFGMDTPFSLDLYVIYLQLQLKIYINIASILGVLMAIIVFKKI